MNTSPEVEEKWKKLKGYIKRDFNKSPDINALLLLIGIQELGRGFITFSKEQKQDLMHIANCKVLSFSGFYELEGVDNDGWPHWTKTKPLPALTLEEQEVFLKEHIILYFSDIYPLDASSQH